MRQGQHSSPLGNYSRKENVERIDTLMRLRRNYREKIAKGCNIESFEAAQPAFRELRAYMDELEELGILREILHYVKVKEKSNY